MKPELNSFWTLEDSHMNYCDVATYECNLQQCPDLMDCCQLFCTDLPTIGGLFLLISIILLLCLFITLITMIARNN